VKVFEFDFSVFDFLRHEDSGVCSGSDVASDRRADAGGYNVPLRLAEAGLRLGAITAEPLVLPAAVEKLRHREKPRSRQMTVENKTKTQTSFNDAGSVGDESLADDDWPPRPGRSSQVSRGRASGYI